MDCEQTEEGIEGLRKQYKKLLDAGVGLEKTHEWLNNEDEILAKMPLLKRENIKVAAILSITVLHIQSADRIFVIGLESHIQP